MTRTPRRTDDLNPDHEATSRRLVTEENRADVARLHGMGLGRNAISRELGLSGATVTNICQAFDPPLSFERKDSELAIRARQLDLADARARISAMMLQRATEQLEAMSESYLIGAFGGKDNVWSEELLAKPPVEVQRNMMTIAAIAVQRHADLVKIDSGRDAEVAESVLEKLAGGLDAAAAALRVSGKNDPTIPGTDPELSPAGVDEATD